MQNEESKSKFHPNLNFKLVDNNNYLSGVFGYLDLALKYTTDEKVAGFLSKVLASSDRAKGLTRQLLTFSKGGAPVKTVAPWPHLSLFCRKLPGLP